MTHITPQKSTIYEGKKAEELENWWKGTVVTALQLAIGGECEC